MCRRLRALASRDSQPSDRYRGLRGIARARDGNISLTLKADLPSRVTCSERTWIASIRPLATTAEYREPTSARSPRASRLFCLANTKSLVVGKSFGHSRRWQPMMKDQATARSIIEVTITAGPSSIGMTRYRWCDPVCGTFLSLLSQRLLLDRSPRSLCKRRLIAGLRRAAI